MPDRVAPTPYSAPSAPELAELVVGAGATTTPLALHRLALRTHARGDELYRAGDRAEAVFVLEAGLVALELDAPRPRIVALAGPGDVIGALVPGRDAYLETATALSGEVIVRQVDALTGAELPPEALAQLLLGAAAARVTMLTHTLEDAEQPVPARIARAFLRLGSRFGQPLTDGTVRLTLPITHDTLAAMVGAARETTTAVIAQFRELGLVQGTRGNYRTRPGALAEYALETALAQ